MIWRICLLVLCILLLQSGLCSPSILISDHPDLFLSTTSANIQVLPTEIEEVLTLIKKPEQYSDQTFYYKTAEISFKYYQQARRELHLEDGEMVPSDAQCPALQNVRLFTDQVISELVGFSNRLVVRYKTANMLGETSISDPIPTIFLKGDLLLWQQASNFLYFFDQAMFWLPVHHQYYAAYNDIIVRMGLYMIDCAPSLVVQPDGSQIYTMKLPEGWIWLDLYNNIKNLNIDLDSSTEFGRMIQDVYNMYQAAFYRNPLVDQRMFRAMQHMWLDYIQREYFLDHQPAEQKPASDVAEDPSTSSGEDPEEQQHQEATASSDHHVIDIHLQPWWFAKDTEHCYMTLCGDSQPTDIHEEALKRVYDPSCMLCLEYADPNYYKWKARYQDRYLARDEDRGPGEGPIVNYVASMREEGGAGLSPFPIIKPAYACLSCCKFTHLECKLHLGHGGVLQKCWNCQRYGWVKEPIKTDINQAKDSLQRDSDNRT